MRSLRFLAFTLLAVMAGCDVERPASARSEDDAHSEEDSGPDPLVLRSRQLALRLQAALARLREPMPPTVRFREQPCPDTEITARAHTAARATLTLTTHDARYSAHSLLPLRLTRPLESQEHVQLARFFEENEQNLSSPWLDELRSDLDAEAADLEIEGLEQRAFKGVFHIVLFKKPHLIRKKNRRKREWTKGVLQAWLVIYDIDSSEALCQTRVITVSDVDDEPISIRLRPETQRRLVADLGRQLRQEAQVALTSISTTLRLPPLPGPSGKLAQVQPLGRQ